MGIGCVTTVFIVMYSIKTSSDVQPEFAEFTVLSLHINVSKLGPAWPQFSKLLPSTIASNIKFRS